METSHGYQAITSQNVLQYNCLSFLQTTSCDATARQCQYLKTKVVIRLTVHRKSSELGQCDYTAQAKYWAFLMCNVLVITCAAPCGLFIDEFLENITHV